jgi:hypothetical protein
MVIEHPIGLPEDMKDKVYFKSLDMYVNTYADFTETILQYHAVPWGGFHGI